MNKKTTNISDLRQEYNLGELHQESSPDDPFKQFGKWFDEAVAGDIYEPNAMVLSTVDEKQPRSRVVLLKGLSTEGFDFYTNYNSHKGNEIAANNTVSLLFYWDRLQRQVRIEGKVVKLPPQVSDEYFSSRPRGSQLGAWVSDQSEVIDNKKVLEDKQLLLTNKFGEELPIPRPEHWGGYRVIPERIEFWQGRPSRLHDRILYTLEGNQWSISRLSP